MGRFTAEDLLKGYITHPVSLNQYIYCWNKPQNLVDLNGLNPNYTAEGGREAHILLQRYFMATYGPMPGVEPHVEFFIPSSVYPGNNHGFADMVLIDHRNLTIQVYEIKPASYLNNYSPESAQRNANAAAQLGRYITGIGRMHSTFQVIPGHTFVSGGVYFPSVVHPGWYITYTPPINGIIYYYYVRNPRQSPHPAFNTNPFEIPTSDANRRLRAFAGGAAIGVGLVALSTLLNPKTKPAAAAFGGVIGSLFATGLALMFDDPIFEQVMGTGVY